MVNQIALARMKLKAFKIKPNKSELKLEEALQLYLPSMKWKRNSGEIVIEGKIPDYFCCNGTKAILELIGRTDVKGHRPEDLEDKEIIYNKWGFPVKWIQYAELRDMDSLLDDIMVWFYTLSSSGAKPKER